MEKCEHKYQKCILKHYCHWKDDSIYTTILGRYCTKCGKLKVTRKDRMNSQHLVGPFYMEYEVDELQKKYPDYEVFSVDYNTKYIKLN